MPRESGELNPQKLQLAFAPRATMCKKIIKFSRPLLKLADWPPFAFLSAVFPHTLGRKFFSKSYSQTSFSVRTALPVKRRFLTNYLSSVRVRVCTVMFSRITFRARTCWNTLAIVIKILPWKQRSSAGKQLEGGISITIIALHGCPGHWYAGCRRLCKPEHQMVPRFGIYKLIKRTRVN